MSERPHRKRQRTEQTRTRRIADEDILNRANAQAQQPASLVTLKHYVETRFKPDHVWALKHAGKLHYEYILDKHVLPALAKFVCGI